MDLFMLEDAELLPGAVRRVVDHYLAKIREEGIDAITSFGIIGSAAMKDFYIGKSDIDFMASTSRKLTEEEVLALGRIHKEIDLKFEPDLNGFYLEERLYREPLQDDISCYVCFNAQVYKGTRPVMYAMPYFQLKTASIMVYGNMPEIYFDHGLLIKQLYENINTNWADWIKAHTFPGLKSFRMMALPHLTEWSVLNVGRYLYVLRTGTIVSKKDTGLYLLDHFPERYQDIIKQAIELLPVSKGTMNYSFLRYNKTIAVLNALLNSFNEEYNTRLSDRLR